MWMFDKRGGSIEGQETQFGFFSCAVSSADDLWPMLVMMQ
jgi:hypothetical protein